MTNLIVAPSRPGAAPDADQDVERDQHRLEEDVEEEQVLRGEDADDRAGQEQHQPVVGARPLAADPDARRRSRPRITTTRQPDEPEREAEEADVVRDAEVAEPVACCCSNWSPPVEVEADERRRSRGRPRRARRASASAPDQRARQRQRARRASAPPIGQEDQDGRQPVVIAPRRRRRRGRRRRAAIASAYVRTKPGLDACATPAPDLADASRPMPVERAARRAGVSTTRVEPRRERDGRAGRRRSRTASSK